MSLSQSFNQASYATAAPAPAAATPQMLGQELLDLVSRPMDGNSANLNISTRSKELIDKGADLTQRDATHGRTALIWTAIYFRTFIMRGIIDKGADLDAQDNDGKTAIDHATALKIKPAIEILQKAKDDIRAQVLKEARDMTTRRDFSAMRPLALRKRKKESRTADKNRRGTPA